MNIVTHALNKALKMIDDMPGVKMSDAMDTRAEICRALDDISAEYSKKQELGDVCNWHQPTYSDAECNAWQADCDQYWSITEGTPAENGMKYCHGCGKLIKEHPYADSEDEE